MAGKKRDGKRERKLTKLSIQWKASQVSDNLKIPLGQVKAQSEIRSPMRTDVLKSKGARGGSSPYGAGERFIGRHAATPRRFSTK